ncbi:VOC family protein [Azorhizobium oxalatiphilum]|uniref:VOC family protein n=1 Tax=Azorhizobium oxalatiphilum TaxID=980631 RepID=A0A917FGM3_9HYPH|nr:VOC family protein [Azorhizobium oxalatiphilum]GGF80826.1 VOC family protein [Azorhizobium oxalatiphilum]
MAKISPCLWFKGEAEEAARFYVSLLPDSRIDHIQRNHVDTPGGPAGSVMVVTFTLAGQPFMAMNGCTTPEYTAAVSFKVDCADQAEIDRLWAALGEGGTEQQCGWITDRYGVPWQIVPEILPRLLSDAQRAPRVMSALMGMVKLDMAALEAA